MGFEELVGKIKIFINDDLGNKHDLYIDVVTDDCNRFRGLSISNESIIEITDDEFRSFKHNLFINFGIYISELMVVIEYEMFNIFIYDEHYFRAKKIDKLINRKKNKLNIGY